MILAEPSGAPRNLVVSSSTTTSITLTWDRISCMDRNGNITGYKIQYGITAFDQTMMFNGTSESSRIFTLGDLVTTNRYKFRVAGVNINGTGPYREVTNLMPSRCEYFFSS